MYNMEFYGFSLLCRVQQACNYYFNSSHGCREQDNGTILDFSGLGCPDCPENIKTLDIVGRLLNGNLSPEIVGCIADSCKKVGLSKILYNISQWTPDRKRSILTMVNGSGKNKVCVAASVGYSLKSRDYLYTTQVTTRQCAELCVTFMDLARERGLFATAKN